MVSLLLQKSDLPSHVSSTTKRIFVDHFTFTNRHFIIDRVS